MRLAGCLGTGSRPSPPAPRARTSPCHSPGPLSPVLPPQSANILVGIRDKVPHGKLCDFGLAKQRRQTYVTGEPPSRPAPGLSTAVATSQQQVRPWGAACVLAWPDPRRPRKPMRPFQTLPLPGPPPRRQLAARHAPLDGP
jgi:hypothetical protein